MGTCMYHDAQRPMKTTSMKNVTSLYEEMIIIIIEDIYMS